MPATFCFPSSQFPAAAARGKRTMLIELTINYWSEGVLCFDPEKVAARLKIAIPHLVIDPTDWADREVEQIEHHVETHPLSTDRRHEMLRQIKGKARRNGPVFKLSLVTDDGRTLDGHASRYSTWIRIPTEIAQAYQERIVDVFKSFGAGEIRVSNDTE